MAQSNNNTRHAQFNALTVTGRIFNAEVVERADGNFLSVTIISTATKDGEDLTYTFSNSNGLMKLHENGHFNKGREVTITGHIAGIRTAYRNKDGAVKLLQRPEVRMVGVQCLDGGLGRKPMDAATKSENLGGMTVTQEDGSPAVDETPSMEKKPVVMAHAKKADY